LNIPRWIFLLSWLLFLNVHVVCDSWITSAIDRSKLQVSLGERTSAADAARPSLLLDWFDGGQTGSHWSNRSRQRRWCRRRGWLRRIGRWHDRSQNQEGGVPAWDVVRAGGGVAFSRAISLFLNMAACGGNLWKNDRVHFEFGNGPKMFVVVCRWVLNWGWSKWMGDVLQLMSLMQWSKIDVREDFIKSCG